MLFGVNGGAYSSVGADEFAAIDGSSLGMIGKLQECIQRAISQLNYETAVFLSEILYAECYPLDRNQMHRLDSVYLYALSLYMNEEYHTALSVVKEFKSSNHTGICYIFARCCLRLSTSLNDAIASLLTVLNRKPSVTTTTNSNSNLISIPNGATLNGILGKLYSKLDKTQESALYHTEALNSDPYLWESYTALCHMKVKIDLKRLYSIMNQKSQNLGSNTNRFKARFNVSKPQPMVTPYKVSSGTSSSSSSTMSSTNQQQQHHQHNQQQAQQIQSSILPHQTSTKGLPSGSLLNKANVVVSTNGLSPSSSKNSATTTANSLGRTSRNKLLVTPPSKLLNTTNFKTPRANNANGNYTNTKKLENIMSSKPEHNGTILPKNLRSSSSSSANVSMPLQELMFNFARILKASSQFDSYRAIRLLESQLPPHINSRMPWCQAQLGKLHFEIVNYEMSLQHFSNLRQLQPTRVEDIEIFSTLLWHLHDKVKLSHLANELIEILPNKPQTWCCLGNLFSLQRDHEEAIKYFEKATGLDPTFAYGYTLQAHEHSSNDSVDTAKNCYRKAIACNPQHYNAYYGLGMCCMKLGQYEEALLFFEKARNINPVNVILICCCGVALEKLSYQEKALQYYELACDLQPNSSLAKFKKAHLLYSMARYSVALENFEDLTRLAPDEATVHFLLGQLYQIMGRKKDAVKEFTIAMNLDPKGNSLIVDALEKCHVQE